MHRLVIAIVACVTGLLLSTMAHAQGQASISGMVKDASGAVLAGVTVEASSPALIEKVRTVVTDGAGVYSIVALPPGTYTVTFTLSGFSTVKREGIELTGAFNAEVNADLRVGALEETITVSGASPVVDVKNTLSQTVLTKEQIETLPGGRTLKGRAALIPGVIVPSANTGVVSHGSDSNDSNIMTDGYKSGQHLVGRGTGGLGVGWGTQSQEAVIEELVYDTGGQGAEFASSGVRMNMIPKEGGNRFQPRVSPTPATSISSRATSRRTSQRPGSSTRTQLFAYDFNPTAGGPIKKRQALVLRVVFGEQQERRSSGYLLQAERAVDAAGVPESSGRRSEPMVPCHHGRFLRIRRRRCASPIKSLRGTSSATASTTRRFTQVRGNFTTGGSKVSPEASWYLPLYPTYLAQVKYTAPLTNRLLIEAGVSYERGDFEVGVPACQLVDRACRCEIPGTELVLREPLFELHVSAAPAEHESLGRVRDRLAQRQGRVSRIGVATRSRPTRITATCRLRTVHQRRAGVVSPW